MPAKVYYWNLERQHKSVLGKTLFIVSARVSPKMNGSAKKYLYCSYWTAYVLASNPPFQNPPPLTYMEGLLSAIICSSG